MINMQRRAISPVIATIIIVAIAIALAIAVAFWMTGVVGLFTGFEQVKIFSVYAEWYNKNKTWDIYVILKNTGSSDATIDEIYLNGKPYVYWNSLNSSISTTITVGKKSYNETVFDSMGGTGVPFPSGTEATIKISLPQSLAKHGQSIEVKVHTASGQEYPKLVVLP